MARQEPPSVFDMKCCGYCLATERLAPRIPKTAPHKAEHAAQVVGLALMLEEPEVSRVLIARSVDHVPMVRVQLNALEPHSAIQPG